MANSEEIFPQVRKIASFKLHKPLEEVTADKTFGELGADSLDKDDLIMEIEEVFNIAISDKVAKEIKTIGDLANKVVELKNK